jgi:hypothetical protein
MFFDFGKCCTSRNLIVTHHMYMNMVDCFVFLPISCHPKPVRRLVSHCSTDFDEHRRNQKNSLEADFSLFRALIFRAHITFLHVACHPTCRPKCSRRLKPWRRMERVTGIEPVSDAWEASIISTIRYPQKLT